MAKIEQHKKTILYIGGATRSGSTLLEMILGNIPGYVSIGEARYLWEHLQAGDILCGCGNYLEKCEIWSSVIRQLRDQSNLDVDRNAFLSQKIDRTRNLLWLETNTVLDKKLIQEYVSVTKKLYQAIFQHVGNNVIIDSSKVPSHIYLLKQIPNIDLRIIHLVRDGRAVAYSWSKRQKRELAITSQKAWMPRRSAFNAVAAWAMEHYFMLRLSRLANHYTLLRYEDFTRQPAIEISKALSNLDFDPVDLSWLTSSHLSLKPNHSVNGNPIRFANKQLTIKYDDEWMREMSTGLRWLLGVSIFPLLNRFGYPI